MRHLMITFLLWFSCVMLFYTIAGYPLLILTRGYFSRCSKHHLDTLPSISVVVCARNEEAVIRARLENLLEMDYPDELLEIVVVSDGSEDATDIIVNEFKQRGVKLVRCETPEGKAAAVNRGVAAATHDIVLMCDARQLFDEEVARYLVNHFADHEVGAVSGRLVIAQEKGSSAGKGVGGYWEYEVLLREAEAKSGSVIGVTGAIYGLRRKLFDPIPAETVLDDVLIPMNVVLSGHRVVFEKRAMAYDKKQISDSTELTRKVRTLYGNLQLLKLRPELFSYSKNPAWFRFISHKISRLFLPLFFGICLISSLLAEGIFFWFGMVQLGLWGAALIGLRKKEASGKIFQLAGGLLLLNIAVVLAWYKFIKGDTQVWAKPTTSLR